MTDKPKILDVNLELTKHLVEDFDYLTELLTTRQVDGYCLVAVYDKKDTENDQIMETYMGGMFGDKKQLLNAIEVSINQMLNNDSTLASSNETKH